ELQRIVAQSRSFEAQRQRARAEQNFRRAREAVTEMLMQVQEKRWEHLPEIGDLRQALAERLVHKFQYFLEQSSSDPGMRLEAGLANMLVGHVYRIQGDTAGALAAHRKAVQLLADLTTEFPEQANYHAELALGHNTLGLEFDSLGR